MGTHAYRIIKIHREDDCMFSTRDEEVMDIANRRFMSDGTGYVEFSREDVEEAIQFDEINEETRDVMEQIHKVMEETGEDYVEFVCF